VDSYISSATRRRRNLGDTLTVSQAAVRLGISRTYAYELFTQGRLPGGMRLGGRIVVSKKLLQAFLDGEDVFSRPDADGRS
jgi:excisionase family DNA binding protein